MVLLVGRRVIIENFEAIAILPPINGFFFFAFSAVVNVARSFFGASWSKKKTPPVGAGSAGRHG